MHAISQTVSGHEEYFLENGKTTNIPYQDFFKKYLKHLNQAPPYVLKKIITYWHNIVFEGVASVQAKGMPMAVPTDEDAAFEQAFADMELDAPNAGIDDYHAGKFVSLFFDSSVQAKLPSSPSTPAQPFAQPPQCRPITACAHYSPVHDTVL